MDLWADGKYLSSAILDIEANIIIMSYVYILITILLTVYGQIVIKWQVMQVGAVPSDAAEKVVFFFRLLINPWVFSAFVAALLASMFWMAAMTKLQLSHAYPFMSATFVLVLILSSLIFHEPLTWPKLVGLGFIVAGIVAGSQG
jgi:multidrug transporter EmrE-like cation transporter